MNESYGERLILKINELIERADSMGLGKDRIISLHPSDCEKVIDTIQEKTGVKLSTSRIFGMPVHRAGRSPLGEIVIMPLSKFNELYGTTISYGVNEDGLVEKAN
jgi:hypothetical protein